MWNITPTTGCPCAQHRSESINNIPGKTPNQSNSLSTREAISTFLGCNTFPSDSESHRAGQSTTEETPGAANGLLPMPDQPVKAPKPKSAVSETGQTLTPMSDTLCQTAVTQMITRLQNDSTAHTEDPSRTPGAELLAALKKIVAEIEAENEHTGDYQFGLTSSDDAKQLLSSPKGTNFVLNMIKHTDNHAALGIAGRLHWIDLNPSSIEVAMNRNGGLAPTPDGYAELKALMGELKILQETGKKGGRVRNKPADAPPLFGDELISALQSAQTGGYKNTVIARVKLDAPPQHDRTGQQQLVFVLKSGEGGKHMAAAQKGRPACGTEPPVVLQERRSNMPPPALFSTDNSQIRLDSRIFAFRNFNGESGPDTEHIRNGVYEALEKCLNDSEPAVIELTGYLFDNLKLSERAHRVMPRHVTPKLKSGETESAEIPIGEITDSSSGKGYNTRLLDTEHMLLTFLHDWHEWRLEKAETASTGEAQAHAHQPQSQNNRTPNTGLKNLELAFLTYLPPCSSCSLGLNMLPFLDEFNFIKKMTVINGNGRIAPGADRKQQSGEADPHAAQSGNPHGDIAAEPIEAQSGGGSESSSLTHMNNLDSSDNEEVSSRKQSQSPTETGLR